MCGRSGARRVRIGASCSCSAVEDAEDAGEAGVEVDAVDAVVLGCTHYPLISAAINRALGPEVRLISSAGQTALEVGRILSRREYLRRPRSPEDTGDSAFVCSADPEEFATLGSRFLSEEIKAVSPQAVTLAAMFDSTA